MNYVGWVPTVIGRLSFSTIGYGKHPSECWKKEGDDQFIIMQRRDLLDVLVPFAGNSQFWDFVREFISKCFLGKTGRFLFVMTASISNRGETCNGLVYLISLSRNRKLKKRMYAWFRHKGNMGTWKKELEVSISKESQYTAKFEIERGGCAKIWPQNNPVAFATSNLENHLANQVFFFLKDVSHVHQHHDASHDAITELTKIERKSDNGKWIAETRNSLSRAVIRYKRFRNEKALLRSVGILAYLKSFQNLYEETPISNKILNADIIKKSLRSSIDELEYFDSKKVSFLQLLFSFFCSLVCLDLLYQSLSYIDWGILTE